MSGRKPDFEDELRRALRPQDPGPEFLGAVLHAAGGKPPKVAPLSMAAARALRIPSVRIGAALAATFVAAVGVVRWDHYLQQGNEAREQVMQALLLASQNLNVVHRVVQDSEERL
jgi:hypothetical protein